MIKIFYFLIPLFLFSACAQKSFPSPEKLKQNRVIFVGEYHDNYAHHINQKKIIQKLYESGASVAIGLEMFQQPFQHVLDDYIAGKIDEKTMLQKSEYFSRWGYDYTLYRPIMIYAKAHHIPLIALNIEKELSKKVSHKGLASLSKKEKKKIPKDLDFKDKAYKERLLKVFNTDAHLEAIPKEHRPNLEFFYQAQILWDESMAKRAAAYLKSHPHTIMIVLAGNGHLEYYVGIPNRLKRRLNVPMQVILQDSDKEPNKADDFLFPEPIMIEGTPKLGVLLAAKSLKVLSVNKDSLAQKVGIQKEDILVAIGTMKVKNLADLRLALYLFHTMPITVQRAGKEKILK